MKPVPFRFKQFSVAHNKCAMKVSTDSVLLGAWQDVNDAKNMLDIGTGSGVLALIMAQKNSDALIDAIEIDAAAFEQARENFLNSPWKARLTAIKGEIQEYRPGKHYDLIISNPPYFVGDLKSPNEQKNMARHGFALSYEDLLDSVNRLLTAYGRALISLPAFNFSKFEAQAAFRKLYVAAATDVIATGDKPPYLTLVRLQKTEGPLKKSSIQIQNSEGGFTEQYKTLTGDFYLKF